MAARLVLPAHRPAAWRALLPGTLPKRPDRHLDRRAPQQVRPDPRQLLEQARAFPGSLHPVPRKKPVQMRRPHSQPSHENWPTRRSEHAQWPDPTRPDSAGRIVCVVRRAGPAHHAHTPHSTRIPTVQAPGPTRAGSVRPAPGPVPPAAWDEEGWYRSLGGTPEPPEYPKPGAEVPPRPLLTSPQRRT